MTPISDYEITLISAYAFRGFDPAVVVNVETTGLDPDSDRIVSIGALKADFSKFKESWRGDIENFHGRLNPQMPIPAAASRIHGITDADVRDEKAFSDIAQSLRDFIGDLPIIGHNVQFNKRFLSAEFKRAGVKNLYRNPHYCTMKRLEDHYRMCGKEIRNPKLEGAVELFNITGRWDEHNDALEKTFIVLQAAIGFYVLDTNENLVHRPAQQHEPSNPLQETTKDLAETNRALAGSEQEMAEFERESAKSDQRCDKHAQWGDEYEQWKANHEDWITNHENWMTEQEFAAINWEGDEKEKWMEELDGWMEEHERWIAEHGEWVVRCKQERDEYEQYWAKHKEPAMDEHMQWLAEFEEQYVAEHEQEIAEHQERISDHEQAITDHKKEMDKTEQWRVELDQQTAVFKEVHADYDQFTTGNGHELAARLTKEAQSVHEQLGSILKTAARFNPSKEMKAHHLPSKFPDRKPKRTKKPQQSKDLYVGRMPIAPEKPKGPVKSNDPDPEQNSNIEKRQPSFDLNRYFKGFLRQERQVVKSAKQSPQATYERELSDWKERQFVYEIELKAWQKLREEKERDNQEEYDAKLRKWEEKNRAYESDLRDWEERKRHYESKVQDQNQKLNLLQSDYRKSTESLREYIALCINSFLKLLPLELPNSERIPSVSLAYDSETQALVIDVRLPTPDKIPSLREVKYVKTRGEQKKIYLSERERDRLYDDILYQLAISLITVVLKADPNKVVSLVVCNGRVRFRDEATGNLVDSCIISLQSDRKEFEEIQVEYVNAKACFRKLKGIGSGKLHGLVPVAPLLELNTKDDRIVASRSVTSGLEEGENLAAMDWEDFEHLVREVFEKEFGQSGGEVKITRASRDRGVDAIAFDPDPIRGGKIVIQAKRYTNLVGVDAVRDLYGTVVSEGANLGILITTSKYGPDSYSFAKDKPLRLLDGSNLLHLLEKHDYRAKIDLREAKAILSERERNRD